MADTVLMPKLGFDMAEGTLVRWVKAEGEAIKKGEVLAEIETDKATVEVESSFSGVVLKQLVAEKSIVPVSAPIAIIGEPGEKVDAAAPAASQKPTEGKAEPKPVEGKAEPKPAEGKVEPESAEGKAEPQPAEEKVEPAAQAPAAVPQPVVAEVESGPVKASPLAKRIAKEQNMSLASLKGSGPGGRIVRKDVEMALQAPPQPAAPAVVAAPAPAAAPAASPAPRPALMPVIPVLGEAPADQRLPLDKLRAAIGRRLVEAKQQIPHFYITHEYDLEPLLALRKLVNEMLPEEQKISVNDFLVKATALTLRQFPAINASLVGSEILRHGHINIGVAVALDNGLLTVVCRDADLKSLRQISQEVKEMVARARKGKVHTEDIEGSTFSISNLGMFDVENFIAIINPPEAAILAVGSARQVPVVDAGALKVGTRMKATISADHRVTDGAEAARFMQTLAGYIEKPLTMLVI